MHKYQRPVTPSEISGPLALLVEELVPGGTPVYVDVRPIEGAAPDECFRLVERQVDAFAGKAIFGWSLWVFPTLFVEAEFHSVWERPDGCLIDITPKKREMKRVLFLKDQERLYIGKQVNNLRRKVRQLPLLDSYFKTFDDQHELLNRGERANMHGKIELEGNEALEFQHIVQRRADCHLELQYYFPLVGAYLPCPCGSGKKTKWCHKEYLS